ncbi:xanthine dehydrogenase family protein molybdopterin-binding subunit [Parasynechococcus sp.]|jgi:carbon-monoxide dehydrogenase large subunit|uniref:xanthine dehydrogenase family protein molybdopterin-binding subunit n=1 Tax=Parasynechococcus sp. TaxID=3101203 RepID=UPI003703F29C
MTNSPILGSPVKRKEDKALLNGSAKFMADLSMPGMVHMVFLDSPHAHAKIKKINLDKAKSIEGVLDIITGEDIKQYNPLPVLMNPAGEKGKFPPHPWGFPAGQTILAVDKVRHIGETVAAVAATTLEAAQRAAKNIQVDYEVLPHVLDARSALKDGAPIVHDNIPDNVCQYVSWGNKEAAQAAIGKAEVVVNHHLPYQLVSACPVETRSTIADYDSTTEDYTLWTNTQIPHINRAALCGLVLGIPFNKLRVVVPEVGGSYGCKGYIYNDTAVALVMAKRVGRPVKWVDTREGLYRRTTHARGSDVDATIAGDKSGKISALYCSNFATLGAYSTFNGPGAPAALTGMSVTGAYAIEHPFYEVNIAYSNRQMVGPMRGAGRTEGLYVIERLIDLYADEIGMDPVDVRRINYIKNDDFPYKNGLGFTYDSGNYELALDQALDKANLKEIEQKRQEAATRGKLLGFGVSSYAAVTGVGPSPYMHNVIGLNGGTYGTAHLRVHQSGDAQLHIGSQPHGQGHVTVFSQVVAEELGIDLDRIEVIHSDTKGNLPIGGSYGSRSYQIEGGAVAVACQKVKAKATTMAAHMLGCRAEDIIHQQGEYSVRTDASKKVTLPEISNALHNAWDLPEGLDPGLEMIAYWDPKDFAFPFGSHVAFVEIDQDTGEVDVVQYIAVDDFGKVCNPGIVDGQTHGNIYAGLSQALMEQIVHDKNGVVINSLELHYGSVRPSHLPLFDVTRTETTTPHTPHGGKGAGDVAINGVPPAVVSAVCNAIGVKHIDTPLTPEKVWMAMQSKP